MYKRSKTVKDLIDPCYYCKQSILRGQFKYKNSFTQIHEDCFEFFVADCYERSSGYGIETDGKRQLIMESIGLIKADRGLYLAGIFLKEKNTPNMERMVCIPSYKILNAFYNYLIALRGIEEVSEKIKHDPSSVKLYEKQMEDKMSRDFFEEI